MKDHEQMASDFLNEWIRKHFPELVKKLGCDPRTMLTKGQMHEVLAAMEKMAPTNRLDRVIKIMDGKL